MNAFHPPRSQRGASLIVALMFLIVLTILGLVSVRSSTLHERMAGNDRDRSVAFEAAEAALRDAERDVQNNITPANVFAVGCGAGLCLPSTTAVPVWESVAWTNADSRLYGATSGAGAFPIADVTQPPRYIIELLPNILQACAGCPQDVGAAGGGTPYRITARGWGRRGTTQVILQSIYVKQ